MIPIKKISRVIFRYVLVIGCIVGLLPGDISAYTLSSHFAQPPRHRTMLRRCHLTNWTLWWRPIALYPDPLLAQVLVASTYPLEIIQLQQWLAKNPGLKDQALADAVAKKPWDPSIQALAGLPEVVKRLADDIQWTTDLGNAFLAQQSEVMDAVQRMRKKAQEKGNLKSTDQIKVYTKVVESKQAIMIERANPRVVYVKLETNAAESKEVIVIEQANPQVVYVPS